MPVELGRQQPAWPSAPAGLAVAWSRWWRGAGGHGGARLGVGVARGRSASRGRNSVGPVGLVGTIQAGWNGGLLQSGTGSPGSRQTPAFG